MRSFSLLFTRRLVFAYGTLASSTIIGSYANANEQKHQSILKSIVRSFSDALMGNQGFTFFWLLLIFEEILFVFKSHLWFHHRLAMIHLFR